jgi:MoaA/NifB/PqqE/SkfB family radical SAM enzyme
MRVADEIIRLGVPYVMLCGGEPLVVPHFLALAEKLGAPASAQDREQRAAPRRAVAERLARLPIRSVQISLDGDTEATYARQRVGASLAAAHAACRAVRAAGMPLESHVRADPHQPARGRAVIERAHSLGAFRFNTGRLMRIGTAARLWDRLEASEPSGASSARCSSAARRFAGEMELCFEPFEIGDGLRASLDSPPATLLVLPNGWVKVAAPLPQICADLRHDRLDEAWNAYRAAWRSDKVRSAARRSIEIRRMLATRMAGRPLPAESRSSRRSMSEANQTIEPAKGMPNRRPSPRRRRQAGLGNAQARRRSEQVMAQPYIRFT